ncbi:hypothetical protein [Streptomyces niveus]|uniref:hypothetical protein n=1 Tax=Streptomyces niveus TaxID=193462 RepID=UPI00342763DA
MPKPVQLIEFDPAEQEALLEASQPKGIDSAMRAVTARIKQQLKVVAELASHRSVGASPERLIAARAGIEAGLAVLKVCPAGEVADLRKRLEAARALIDEALEISGSVAASSPTDRQVENSRAQADLVVGEAR